IDKCPIENFEVAPDAMIVHETRRHAREQLMLRSQGVLPVVHTLDAIGWIAVGPESEGRAGRRADLVVLRNIVAVGLESGLSRIACRRAWNECTIRPVTDIAGHNGVGVATRPTAGVLHVVLAEARFEGG